MPKSLGAETDKQGDGAGHESVLKQQCVGFKQCVYLSLHSKGYQ